MTRETVADALAALDEADVVVGHAEDGGYYLLALQAPRPELLEGVAWSTPTVLEQTLAEEKAADEKLTGIAEGNVNRKAA